MIHLGKSVWRCSLAELILTEAEKAAASYLDWDDAALGRFAKYLALLIEAHKDDASGLHRVTTASCGMLLIAAAVQNNADKLTLKLDEHTDSGVPTGDWKITVQRVRAPAEPQLSEQPNTDAAQERRLYCGTCTTPNQCKMGECQKAESSPTQTVAFKCPVCFRNTNDSCGRSDCPGRTASTAPGPTAGDVERAREICEPLLYQRPCTGDDIENPGLLLWRRDYDKLIGETAAALQAARAEARAELLAQIREWIESAQSDLAKVRDNYGDSYPVNELGKHIDALADKLTEAK